MVVPPASSMRLASFRRSSKWRLGRILLASFLALNFLETLYVHRSLGSAQLNTTDSLSTAPTEKIFITSTHWNNEAILRGYWNKAVLELVQHFGPPNVYISVYESGSWDDSKGALRELDQRLESLGVRRTIVLDPTTHVDELGKLPAPEGWIDTPRGKKELRRIPYLSKLRNEALRPLESLAHESGSKFDKILFLNDVVFTTEDVDTLLNTNNGDYAAACSLDFSNYPQYYDTFALRDSEGSEAVMQTWPYFRGRTSRHAMKTGSPVPVKSCWNGMGNNYPPLLVDTSSFRIFLLPLLIFSYCLVFMPASPFYESPNPLRFRGIPDTLAARHLEGSECCLVHADNPLTPQKGVWLNPNVRVGYNEAAYKAAHHPPTGAWLSLSEIFFGLWKNRVVRWTTTRFFKEWVVKRRVSTWESSAPTHRRESALHCLINEMQVLVSNGWAHV